MKSRFEDQSMTDAQTRPATEAEVVEGVALAICRCFWTGDQRYDAYQHMYRPAAIATLTAARSLGCLLPEEAAALRASLEMVRQQLVEGWGETVEIGVYEKARTEITTLAARLARAEEALEETAKTPSQKTLAWLAANPQYELSSGGYDENAPAWCVHRVSGGRNDREWTLVGSGATPLQALRSARARAALTPPPSEVGT